MTPSIHVAVAVITNDDGQILIAKRAKQAHQGGLWEFPGGKVETGERLETALKRELQEELGIEVQACQPLLEIHHDYVDKAVFLDVWRVTQFSGQAYGREQQPIRWVDVKSLGDYQFPAANQPILAALIA